MRNIFISLLFMAAFTSHAQNKAEDLDLKSNIEQTPSLEIKQQNLPKGFRGDSLTSLVDKYELFAKSTKDEFTKTSEHNAEIAALRNKPYKFVFTSEMNAGFDKNYNRIASVRYNADAEVMMINLWTTNESFILNRNITNSLFQSAPDFATIKIVQNTKSHSYIGQNAYGAKAKISSTILNEFGLAIANVNLAKNTAIFSLSLPIKPREGKILKEDLSFYLDVNLTTSEVVKGDILKTANGHGATISDPSEFYISGKYILVNIKEVGVYRKSTGEILGWKKFD